MTTIILFLRGYGVEQIGTILIQYKGLICFEKKKAMCRGKNLYYRLE
jgi:hypothetical protein